MAEGSVGRVVLMSIHPCFAWAILRGEKTVEFRKRPLADDVTHVVIYATAPIRKVIGHFSIERQDLMEPEQLWTKYNKVGSIDRDSFFEYYEGRQDAVAIRVGEVRPLTTPLSLQEDLQVRCAPQSFQYLDPDLSRQVLGVA